MAEAAQSAPYSGMTKHIVIYGLQRPGRDIFYVGRTTNLQRRLNEHRRVFKGRIDAIILEVVEASEWRIAEHAWIEAFRDAGLTIANRTEGGDGVETLNANQLAALAKGRRPHTEEELRKMSAAQKGKRKNWSAEGAQRVAENWIKPGTKPWNTFTPDMTEAGKEAIRQRIIANRTDESRQRMSQGSLKANQSWSNYTAEERAARGRRISVVLKNSARLKEANARKGPAASAQMKAWWANMTPEERAELLTAERKSDTRIYSKSRSNLD